MCEATARPIDVAGILAAHRPPDFRRVEISVLPSGPGDPTTLEQVLQAVLTEIVAVWPAGSTWFVEIGRGYLQGVHYAPDALLEVGPRHAHPDMLATAISLGWIDPHRIPRAQSDFRSRPIWGNNPVQEVDWSSTGVPRMAAIVAEAADDVLLAPPGAGFKIELWAPLSAGGSGTDTVVYADDSVAPPEFGFQSDHDCVRWMYSDDPASEQWTVVTVGTEVGRFERREVCQRYADFGLGYGGVSKHFSAWCTGHDYCHIELTDESGITHWVGAQDCAHRNALVEGV